MFVTLFSYIGYKRITTSLPLLSEKKIFREPTFCFIEENRRCTNQRTDLNFKCCRIKLELIVELLFYLQAKVIISFVEKLHRSNN